MEGLGYYQSPCGLLEIKGDENAIHTIRFVKDDTPKNEVLSTAINACKHELHSYFNGSLKTFSIKLDLKGSEFQIKIWKALQEIPFGKSKSYTDLALRIGDINAIRAVGLANGKNPIAIIIPCHRVIGKNGDLVGYAGGLARKKYLLQHEGIVLEQLQIF